MVKHRVFLILTVLEVALLGALLVQSRVVSRRAAAVDVPARRAVVERLGLTDLSLWTEARYARHPSQADLFSAFQDAPSSLEHFPAGSVVVAPCGVQGMQPRPSSVVGIAGQCGD